MPRMNLDKRKILEAAGALANEITLKRLSLNALAARLGIKPPSLYNHVESLDRLKAELTRYGWEALTDNIAAALVGVSGDEAIRKASFAFFDYARKNPGVFEAMAYYRSEGGETGAHPADRLTNILYSLCLARDIKPEDAVHILRIFRSYIEGFAMLSQHGTFLYDASMEESFSFGVEFLIAGVHRLEEKNKKEKEASIG